MGIPAAAAVVLVAAAGLTRVGSPPQGSLWGSLPPGLAVGLAAAGLAVGLAAAGLAAGLAGAGLAAVRVAPGATVASVAGAEAAVGPSGAEGVADRIAARSVGSSVAPFPPGETTSQAATATTITLATASANRGVHPELCADLPASRAAANPIASTRPRLRLTRGANEVIPRNHAESRAALAAVDATLRARLPAARAAARASLRPTRLPQARRCSPSSRLLRPDCCRAASACPIPTALRPTAPRSPRGAATRDGTRSTPPTTPPTSKRGTIRRGYWNSKDAPLVEDDDDRDARFAKRHYPKDLPPG